MFKYLKNLFKTPANTELEEPNIKERLFDIKTIRFTGLNFLETVDKGEVYITLRKLIDNNCEVITEYYNSCYEQNVKDIDTIINELLTSYIILDLSCLLTNDMESSISKNSYLLEARNDITQLINILKVKFQLEIFNDIDSMELFKSHSKELKLVAKVLKEETRGIVSSKSKLFEHQLHNYKDFISLISNNNVIGILTIKNINIHGVDLKIQVQDDGEFSFNTPFSSLVADIFSSVSHDYILLTMYRNISIFYLLGIFVK